MKKILCILLAFILIVIISGVEFYYFKVVDSKLKSIEKANSLLALSIFQNTKKLEELKKLQNPQASQDQKPIKEKRAILASDFFGKVPRENWTKLKMNYEGNIVYKNKTIVKDYNFIPLTAQNAETMEEIEILFVAQGAQPTKDVVCNVLKNKNRFSYFLIPHTQNYLDGQTMTMEEYLSSSDDYYFSTKLRLNHNDDVVYNNKVILKDKNTPLNGNTAYTDREFIIYMVAGGARPEEECGPRDTIKNGTLGCYISLRPAD